MLQIVSFLGLHSNRCRTNVGTHQTNACGSAATISRSQMASVKCFVQSLKPRPCVLAAVRGAALRLQVLWARSSLVASEAVLDALRACDSLSDDSAERRAQLDGITHSLKYVNDKQWWYQCITVFGEKTKVSYACVSNARDRLVQAHQFEAVDQSLMDQIINEAAAQMKTNFDTAMVAKLDGQIKRFVTRVYSRWLLDTERPADQQKGLLYYALRIFGCAFFKNCTYNEYEFHAKPLPLDYPAGLQALMEERARDLRVEHPRVAQCEGFPTRTKSKDGPSSMAALLVFYYCLQRDRDLHLQRLLEEYAPNTSTDFNDRKRQVCKKYRTGCLRSCALLPMASCHVKYLRLNKSVLKDNILPLASKSATVVELQELKEMGVTLCMDATRRLREEDAKAQDDAKLFEENNLDALAERHERKLLRRGQVQKLKQLISASLTIDSPFEVLWRWQKLRLLDKVNVDRLRALIDERLQRGACGLDEVVEYGKHTILSWTAVADKLLPSVRAIRDEETLNRTLAWRQTFGSRWPDALQTALSQRVNELYHALSRQLKKRVKDMVDGVTAQRAKDEDYRQKEEAMSAAREAAKEAARERKRKGERKKEPAKKKHKVKSKTESACQLALWAFEDLRRMSMRRSKEGELIFQFSSLMTDGIGATVIRANEEEKQHESAASAKEDKNVDSCTDGKVKPTLPRAGDKIVGIDPGRRSMLVAVQDGTNRSLDLSTRRHQQESGRLHCQRLSERLLRRKRDVIWTEGNPKTLLEGLLETPSRREHTEEGWRAYVQHVAPRLLSHCQALSSHHIRRWRMESYSRRLQSLDNICKQIKKLGTHIAFGNASKQCSTGFGHAPAPQAAQPLASVQSYCEILANVCTFRVDI